MRERATLLTHCRARLIVSNDGDTLRYDVHIEGAQLPEDVRYRLVYRRVSR